MRTMRIRFTKLVFGIPALVGLCLMQGCGMFGAKETPPSGVEVAQPASVQPEEVKVAPPELPTVQLTTPYTVSKGDTLTAIAARYGLRWQDVAATNPDINPNKLRIGQVIQLPGTLDVPKARSGHRAAAPARKATAPAGARAAAGKTVSYKVQKGDTLSSIAYRHGVKVAALKADNNMTSDVVYVGRTLKIVNPTKTPAAASAGNAAPPAAARQAVAAPPVKAPAVAAEPAKPSMVTPPPKPPVDPFAEGDVAPAEPVVAPPPVETVIPAPPAIPVVEQPKQDKVAYRTYTVKEDEDLYAVAIRWGVSPNEIKAANGLSSNDLTPGTTLKIPIPDGKQ